MKRCRFDPKRMSTESFQTDLELKRGRERTRVSFDVLNTIQESRDSNLTATRLNLARPPKPHVRARSRRSRAGQFALASLEAKDPTSRR